MFRSRVCTRGTAQESSFYRLKRSRCEMNGGKKLAISAITPFNSASGILESEASRLGMSHKFCKITITDKDTFLPGLSSGCGFLSRSDAKDGGSRRNLSSDKRKFGKNTRVLYKCTLLSTMVIVFKKQLPFIRQVGYF